jgi:hypothetical protein
VLVITTEPNIPDPDSFYAALVAAHEGLSEAQSAELNARLVFLLANQVGEQQVLLHRRRRSTARACLRKLWTRSFGGWQRGFIAA